MNELPLALVSTLLAASGTVIAWLAYRMTRIRDLKAEADGLRERVHTLETEAEQLRQQMRVHRQEVISLREENFRLYRRMLKLEDSLCRYTDAPPFRDEAPESPKGGAHE